MGCRLSKSAPAEGETENDTEIIQAKGEYYRQAEVLKIKDTLVKQASVPVDEDELNKSEILKFDVYGEPVVQSFQIMDDN
ncbi:hypothetical protein BgAZ_400850 [Babesia gibsoni]|uniref:Uncharacterized protein n=1 Tax=Babesia gibsoni TaxID=33632 RepID=A0AAD8LG94_BABGI|nr:hypothetical protein BgAZ_400850 [Babesia gibsoni]